MLDRVPLYPGRVKLTPVAGQENTYDMTRADQATQQGTPLNKATFLKDETAALFGLQNTAVPDDALNVLSRFQSGVGNEYVWEKTKKNYNISYGPEEQIIVVGRNESLTYYSSYQVSESGIEFTDPTTILLSDDNYNDPVGKYTYQDGTDKPSIIDLVRRSGNYAYRGRVMTSTETIESYGYVNSPDESAYPPSPSDGFDYIGPKILGSFAAVETGSYVGTGGAGSSQKTSVTFSISPKVLFVSATTNSGSNAFGTAIFVGGAYAGMYIFSQSQDLVLSIDGNTWSWYDPGSNAVYQCNQVNTAYNYVAIG